MLANPIGICAVCGLERPLSFEHVPPKIAGNEPYGRELDIGHYLRNNVGEPLTSIRGRNMPRGSGKYALCEKCNNQTGADYATDYGIWAWQGMRLRGVMGDTNSIALPFRIFPGRVFKQILTIFAATCGPALFENNLWLRRLVLDRNVREMPSDLRMYCYIVHPKSDFSRSSGIFGMLQGGDSHIMAEFAYRPFGYLLTFNGKPPPDTGLFDITFFAQQGYNDYRELHLPLPVRPVETYFPADYRTKDEWVKVTGGGFKLGKES